VFFFKYEWANKFRFRSIVSHFIKLHSAYGKISTAVTDALITFQHIGNSKKKSGKGGGWGWGRAYPSNMNQVKELDRAAALWCQGLQCIQFTTHHTYFAPVTRKSIVYNGSMLDPGPRTENSLLRPFAPSTRQGNLPTILLGQVTGS